LYKQYKERKKTIKKLWERDPSVHSPKSEVLHTPKDTWQFLKLFSDNNGFKFLVHDFDNSEEDFSRAKIVANARKVFDEAKKKGTIPDTLLTRFNAFAFNKKPTWFTWETGKDEKIYLGWSCKELVEWCNNPVNKDVHPFRDARYLDKMITPFKHCIEVRKGKLVTLFNQVIHTKLKGKFEVTPVNLNKATFLTDVNVFQSGLMYLFSPFLEIADLNKEYRVEIAFKTEKVANYRLKVITITHHNSLPNKRSNDEDLLKGDLQEAKERFRNLCNWSIEAKFDDGFKRVHVLNDNPNTPTIEPIEKSEVGFTHVLSFY
jgi:hypothetical protein